MLFSSMIFLWIFLPCILLIYFLIDMKYKNLLLLIASLIFYAWGEPKYIILMLINVGINYYFGICVEEVKSIYIAKLLVGICIIINLLILGYFKYYNFLIESVNAIINSNISSKVIALPVGISFYTFQALSYVVDIYRSRRDHLGIKAQKNFLNLALYISLFPQLIAGPIVKYHDIELQLINRKSNIKTVTYGIKRFSYGLGKKVLISNILAGVADKIFIMPLSELSTGIAWLGIISYTLQIYYDFSGYSDMAIGLGKMFGFEFMENFNYPYISRSIQEFWRRWHIALSTWFKEYLYIPLGGNRKGAIRTYINLLVVFFATGLWHGASWNFIIWGLFHGIFIVIERMGLGKYLKERRYRIISHIYTLLVVIIGWVFFRAETLSYALGFIKTMFIPTIVSIPYAIGYYMTKEILITLIVGIVLCGILQTYIIKFKEILYAQKRTYIYELFVLPCILFFCIMYLVSGAYNPFIYFRF